MVKKIGLLLLALVALTVQSASALGDWRMHPYYVGSKINNIIDTDNKVYYLVGNDLFCYDKTTNANESMNKRANLNDVLITGIYYNYDKKYLVITYLDSNIDIVYDDGRVFNLPDIKDAVLTAVKGINDVKFGQDKMFVATEFGMIVYDDDRPTWIHAEH